MTSSSELVASGLPCPDCGGSDPLAEYDDGHTYCFSCGTHTHNGEKRIDKSGTKTERPKDLINGHNAPLPERRINEETCRRYGYLEGQYKGKRVEIAEVRDQDGNVCGQHIRFPDKTFTTLGRVKNDCQMFGQHLFKPGGKKLVITEGQIDALSYAETVDCKWPCVSVVGGAQGAPKNVAANIEFVSSFEEVILAFDMDEPGQAAAKKVAELLPPGKAKIATLTKKDFNDMLKDGRVKEMNDAVWQAKPYRPDGVVNGMDLWEEIAKPVEMGTPYPWECLNRKLYGLRPKEIVTICAGSGVGKSTLTTEIGYHLANTLKQTVGFLYLEEGRDRSAQRFVGIHLNTPIHLPRLLEGASDPFPEITDEAKRKAFDETLGTGRYYFYDHFGSVESDTLLSRMRYMVVALGCRWVVLDHLSIVVSGFASEGDERQRLDSTITKLRQFTQETGCGLIVVSHLSRPQGRGHEEGAVTSLSQLRGSHAIAQLSDIVIGVERNQQAEDEDERDTTQLRILKNRYAGITGLAGDLRYEHETGRLVEADLAQLDRDF